MFFEEHYVNCSGGGGGFFLAGKDLGDCSTIYSPPVLLLLLFFFKVEISSRTLIPFFRLGSVHSGSAS